MPAQKITLNLLLLTLFLIASIANAKTISNSTKGMSKQVGFFDFYQDDKQGKIWLKVDKFDSAFLYQTALATGIGSNDLGFDRGKLGKGRVVKFIKSGSKVLLVQPNLNYRANTKNKHERSAAQDAFAFSVLWGFKIAASQGKSTLIDITDFLQTDTHKIAKTLKKREQGNYKLDHSRSALFFQNTRNFPNNSEFESILTFASDNPGRLIRSVTPTAEFVTVRTHHSFIKLPDLNYKVRDFHPRSGGMSVDYIDYATPLGASMKKRMLKRHRLEKKNPHQQISDPVKPIVYYLDPGTPEPVRSALLDGARWWSTAFETAGFSNAFKVEILPADADPLDVRYNTIQWVHRSTRGWSYGASVTDPRTGEIIKGHVTLGSLRVRQDMLIAQGLLSPYKNGDEVPIKMQQMALARLRQLAAHEVGHTLGISHNFSASVSNRASVMDYPHPLVKISKDGELDLSEAYAIGIGKWDKLVIQYLYSEYSDKKSEGLALKSILQSATKAGIQYISDADARAAGGSHPYAHLWDNSADAAQELNHVLAVRKRALANFGQHTIPNDTPLFDLEQILVPIYLFHRYQVEAAVKLLAGVNYQYTLRGDNLFSNKIVPAHQQTKALQQLMRTIQADELAVPETILKLLAPPPDKSSRHREHFKNRTGLNFDALAAAETASRITLSLLLHPQRTARLIEQHARNSELPSLDSVIELIINSTWKHRNKNQYHAAVQRGINYTVVQSLMSAANDESSSPQARAIINARLLGLSTWLKKTSFKRANDKAMAAQCIRDIARFMQSDTFKAPDRPLKTPPGSPIG